jgi:hypothetical protein
VFDAARAQLAERDLQGQGRQRPGMHSIEERLIGQCTETFREILP